MDVIEKRILSIEEAQKVVREVNNCSDLFIEQTKDFFYTLGAATYQHVNRLDEYYNNVLFLNQIMFKKFWLLYFKLLEGLENILYEKVYFTKALSYPGFHIFNLGNIENFGGGAPHYDISFKEHDILGDVDVITESLSFTLALELPKEKCGLNMWDLNFREVIESNYVIDPNKECLLRQMKFIQYNVGCLYLFDAFQYHSISSIDTLYANDVRITLQGHVVKKKGKWIVYW